MDNDLISRSALKNAFRAMNNTGTDTFPVSVIAEIIDDAPAVNDDRIPIHDDLCIVKGCISLIRQVLCGEYGIFDQLEADEYDFKTFHENYGCNIGYRLNYFEIVQRLLLAGTSHAGGTSTFAKCRELGLDACEYVHFEYEGEEDEHEAD